MDLPSFMGGGVTVAALLGGGKWVLDNPDKARALWGTVAGWFGWFSQAAKRKQVAADIESVVLAVRKEAEALAPGILPFELQVKWVLPGSVSAESFRENDKVVVRLRHHQERAKNLVAAAVYYAEHCIPNHIERCLSHVWREPVQLTVASKMLAKGGRDSFDEFHSSVLEPRFLSNDYLQPRCVALQSIDHCGFFTRILLFEIHQLGLKHSLDTPAVSVLQETGAFIDFLTNVAERREGEDVELAFNRENLKVGIVLVARPENLTAYGLAPYVNRFDVLCKGGVRSIYLCGRGSHTAAVRALSRMLKRDSRVASVDVAEYVVDGGGRQRSPVKVGCVRVTIK